MVGGSSSFLVLILICLLEQKWGFLQAHACQTVRLDSFGITGLHAEAQSIGSVIVPIAGIFPQCNE